MRSSQSDMCHNYTLSVISSGASQLEQDFCFQELGDDGPPTAGMAAVLRSVRAYEHEKSALRFARLVGAGALPGGRSRGVAAGPVRPGERRVSGRPGARPADLPAFLNG